jgi:hypothetical protein
MKRPPYKSKSIAKNSKEYPHQHLNLTNGFYRMKLIAETDNMEEVIKQRKKEIG